MPAERLMLWVWRLPSGEPQSGRRHPRLSHPLPNRRRRDARLVLGRVDRKSLSMEPAHVANVSAAFLRAPGRRCLGGGARPNCAG